MMDDDRAWSSQAGTNNIVEHYTTYLSFASLGMVNPLSSKGRGHTRMWDLLVLPFRRRVGARL